MSKPLIFLFLFQLIISIDLPNTRSVNNKVEVSENPINAIYKSIDNLFANYDIYQKIKNDFEDANVKLKDKRETIPDRYNNCLKTPYDYMLAAKFDKLSSEVLEVKIFKDEKESLNFIKKGLITSSLSLGADSFCSMAPIFFSSFEISLSRKLILF